MKKFIKNYLTRFLAVLSLVLIGVMIYSASTGGIATIPETLTGIFVTPVQSFFTGISDGVSDFFSQFGGGGEVQKENEQLKQEIAELRKKMVDYNEMKHENEWYQGILELKDNNPDYTFAPGRVIGRDPSDFYGNFTISAGTSSDVSVNDPVVSTDGYLVGVVEEVGLTYAKVRTVLDPSTKVASEIDRTGDNAYTAGGTLELARDNTLRLTALERSSGAAVGDMLITSGIGGIYPRGLLIGSVKSIDNATDGMTLKGEVKVFAETFDLKQVMVITHFDGQESQR
ncbi:MAG: rod shape-determining protein MreC [Ruminococcaceae bacterium]|nr:rod shape-determining protein MreC [Oscillospiraceae bacterium]